MANLINNTGYTKGSPTEANPINIIPSSNITMQGVEYPILGVDNLGIQQVMQPNQNYTFPNASYVTEIPLMQNGGAVHNFINQLNFTPTPNLDLPQAIEIKDTRKKRATTNKAIDPKRDLKTGTYDPQKVIGVIKAAEATGQDPYTLLSMAMAETNLGQANPTNIGQSLEEWVDEEGSAVNQYMNMALTLRDKMEQADRHSITDEATRLQYYNGVGYITNNTERDYDGGGDRYGVKIPKGGINMRENPLYGKEVIDLRENVIKKNPQIRQLVERSASLQTYEVGGKISKDMKGKKTNKKQNGGRTGRGTAVSYDFYGNPIQPQAEPVQPYQGNVQLQVGAPNSPETRGIGLYQPPPQVPSPVQNQPQPTPIPQTGSVSTSTANPAPRNQARSLTFDRVVDKAGRVFLTPVFQGNWGNQREIYAFLQNNIPDEYGGIPVDKAQPQMTAVSSLQQTQGQPFSPYYDREAENGLNLTAAKAKKMLKDGKANGKSLTEAQKRYFGYIAGGGVPQAQNGGNMTPYTPNFYNQQNQIQPFNYGSTADYFNYTQNPNQFDMQASSRQATQAPQQAQPIQQPNSGGATSMIGDAAYAIGDVVRGINSFQNSIITGGGALLNSLLPDNHNQRQTSPQLSDPTYAYQPQYNNMYQNGGALPQQSIPNLPSYLPGEEVDLTPEQVAELRAAGYDLDVL